MTTIVDKNFNIITSNNHSNIIVNGRNNTIKATDSERIFVTGNNNTVDANGAINIYVTGNNNIVNANRAINIYVTGNYNVTDFTNSTCCAVKIDNNTLYCSGSYAFANGYDIDVHGNDFRSIELTKKLSNMQARDLIYDSNFSKKISGNGIFHYDEYKIVIKKDEKEIIIANTDSYDNDTYDMASVELHNPLPHELTITIEKCRINDKYVYLVTGDNDNIKFWLLPGIIAGPVVVDYFKTFTNASCQRRSKFW